MCFGFKQGLKLEVTHPDLALRHEGSCVKKTRILPENSGQKLSELEERVFLAATVIRVFS